MKRKKLYTDNIYSPSRVLLVPEAFYNDSASSDSFYIDAVSCYKLKEIVCCSGIMLNQFQVEFWDERSADLYLMVKVVIHAPTSWSPEMFLQHFEKVSWNCHVFSLIHGYWIYGVEFPYVTVNTLHCYFKSK